MKVTRAVLPFLPLCRRLPIDKNQRVAFDNGDPFANLGVHARASLAASKISLLKRR